MERDLGTEGQRYFGVLCSNAGLHANQSLEKDATGWYWHVEFPLPAERKKSLDELPSPIECKVQVKSTETKSKKVQIKLSALYRLVKTHLPSFIVLFKYGEKHEPEAAYLLHIDKEWIERILKRVRTYEARGQGVHLHKKKMTLAYSQTLRLSEVSGASVKSALESYISGGLDIYTRTKIKMLNELGFDEFTHKAKITFFSKGNRVQEELIDLLIGKREAVDVRDFQVFSSRFGIELPDTSCSQSSCGKLSIVDHKPSFCGAISFKEGKYSVPVELKAAFFTLPAEWKVPPDKSKFRADTDLFELLFRKGAIDFKLKGLGEEKIPLSDLFSRVWLLDKISSGANLTLSVIRNGNTYEIGTLNGAAQAFGDFSRILALIERAVSICDKLRISTGQVSVNCGMLLRFEESISQLHGLMFPPAGMFKIVFPPERKVMTDDLSSLALVIGNKARIGTACFAYAYAVLFGTGSARCTEEGLEAYSSTTKLSLVRYGTVDEISAINLEKIKEELAGEIELDGLRVSIYEQ